MDQDAWRGSDLGDVRRLNEAATLLRHPELIRSGNIKADVSTREMTTFRSHVGTQSVNPY